MGSKNAAFYLGKTIKMSTKQADGKYVHELSISASDLEQRYKQGQVRLLGQPSHFVQYSECTQAMCGAIVKHALLVLLIHGQ